MTQNALATKETGAVVQADSASIMEIIARAASDPSVDVEKLERLAGLYERISDKNAEVAFNQAMNEAQGKIGPVFARAKNSQTNSKYATFADIDKKVRPIYTAHGFSLSFNTADGAPDNHVRVTCRVAHSAGHSILYQADMPADGKGAKGGDVMTKTHATGAAFTYGQRYLFKLIFNVAVSVDDDGNRAGGSTKVGVTPEGADFWDCAGPGISAHQARQNGMDDLHELMRQEIAEQTNAADMNAWIDRRLPDVQRLPKAWRVILRQEVDERGRTF